MCQMIGTERRRADTRRQRASTGTRVSAHGGISWPVCLAPMLVTIRSMSFHQRTAPGQGWQKTRPCRRYAREDIARTLPEAVLGLDLSSFGDIIWATRLDQWRSERRFLPRPSRAQLTVRCLALLAWFVCLNRSATLIMTSQTVRNRHASLPSGARRNKTLTSEQERQLGVHTSAD